MRPAWLIVLTLSAACASNARVARLETRVAAAEEAQAKSDLELRASQARIEKLLERLAGAAARAEEAADTAANLEDQLAALERRIATPPQPPQPARPRPGQPDPALTYAVPVGKAPTRGKSTALVTIIMAGEYACPFCDRVRGTIDQVLTAYGDKVRLVHRSFIVHQQTATYAAQAACAAHRQGKFWALDPALWTEAFGKRRFAPADIDQIAAGVGLDLNRYRADVAGPCVAEVEADQRELAKFGVGATPSFFINGRFIAGAQPVAAFRALVDEELAKAEAAVKRGVKPGRYYQQEILGKGLPSVTIAPPTGATP